MKFGAKYDVLNILFLFVLIGVFAIPFFVFPFAVWYLVVFIIISLGLIVTYFCTSYTLTESGLTIRSGFITFSIDYDRILEIKKVRTLKSGTKTALNSIEITYGKSMNLTHSSVLVSPKREEEFLNILKKNSIKVNEIKSTRK